MNESKFKKAWEYSELMEFEKWAKEIPFIKFPCDWQIQPTPPFGGAVVRFRVKKGNAEVSIYLDCYEVLGYASGNPYWEVYPYYDDTYRCALNDIGDLLSAISLSIEQQNN